MEAGLLADAWNRGLTSITDLAEWCFAQNVEDTKHHES